MKKDNCKCAFLVEKRTPEFDLAFSSNVMDRLIEFNNGCDLQIITKDDLVGNASFPTICYLFSTWNMPKLASGEIKQYFPSLECVFYAAGTVKYFAQPFFDCGVRIFSASAENAIPVAEIASSLIVLASKGAFCSKITPMSHFFSAKKKAVVHSGNYHAKVGILGAGNVGRAVIGILKRETDLDILVYDPYVSDEKCKAIGATKASLEELFETCDVISNHMPDIDATKGIINKSALSLMKPTAGILNTGRGAQIIEKDLVAALKSHRDRFAVLDVTYPEPIRPWNPLLRMSNVYITPHIAGSMGTEIERLGMAMCDACRAVAEGEKTHTEVFPNQLANMA